MADIFRSSDFGLYSFTLLKDNAYEFMNFIGKLGILQIHDTNKGKEFLNMPHLKMINKCEEMLSIIQ